MNQNKIVGQVGQDINVLRELSSLKANLLTLASELIDGGGGMTNRQIAYDLLMQIDQLGDIERRQMVGSRGKSFRQLSNLCEQEEALEETKMAGSTL
ncbi:hypothetical protein DRW41_17185 [Neobacillus piezotolerans]|uniref:Uncharacterized protein n=1 Tax=Neobacillus piezotolerans TaxID=2259171 RepID=A0A3D8GLX8_9BACI|nr:hypothetical protein [Neobacillus piezotolerans]RDU35474.1 hypothetical protein DRW41_17185 [Neobacillus piezotolerans]